MKEQLEQRLAELKTEFESGQKAMSDLETKKANLRDTLLRISGAIQILEEELSRVSEESESIQPGDREIKNAIAEPETS